MEVKVSAPYKTEKANSTKISKIPKMTAIGTVGFIAKHENNRLPPPPPRARQTRYTRRASVRCHSILQRRRLICSAAIVVVAACSRRLLIGALRTTSVAASMRAPSGRQQVDKRFGLRPAAASIARKQRHLRSVTAATATAAAAAAAAIGHSAAPRRLSSLSFGAR